MATIDLERLLAPLSADSPAGENLEYDPQFGEMERAAVGKGEQQFGNTIIPAEEPDWRAVKTQTGKLLDRSKDLRAAALLTKALVHTDGFAGLADGLTLIQGFITDFWESVHPQLDPDDDNDPTLRTNTLISLCDPIQFLKAIAMVPLVSSKVLGSFSLRDIQIAEGTLSPTGDEGREISLDHIDGAFRESSPDDMQRLLAQIRSAAASAASIESELNQRVGIEQSPSLQTLSELLQLAEREVVTRTGGNMAEESVEESGSSPPGETSRNSEPVATGAIRNRDDVIRTLEKLCLYYEQNDPSSPVPLLLKRAKRLVKKDFFDIVQDLAPDGSAHFEFLWKQEKST